MTTRKETIYDRSALAGNAAKTPPRGASFVSNDPKLTIRVIGKCNFHCPACSTFSSPKRKGVLSSGDFKKAVDALDKARFRGVLNISGGEPFLHPKLFKMVECASKTLDTGIVLFTNGFWIGRPNWKTRLKRILSLKNVLLRFSIDVQHMDGAILAEGGRVTASSRALKKDVYLEKALLFKSECERLGARPGKKFDFAYKGTLDEGRAFLKKLGDSPIYPILMQKKPAKRAREFGYMAIDIDERGLPLVYLTLGHLAEKLPMGGLDSLAGAIQMSRAAIKKGIRGK